MDITTYIGIAVGLVLALLFWKVDDLFDRVLGWFLNPIFSLIGLDSAGGPFTSQVRELDNCIELVIQKEGSGKAAPAAIVVTGSGNRKPIRFLISVSKKQTRVCQRKIKRNCVNNLRINKFLRMKKYRFLVQRMN